MDSLSRSSQVPHCYERVADETPEESSWTMYFEDFLNENNVIDHMNGNNSCFSSDINYQTSSLVSAAGRHVFGASLDHKSFNKNRLSFKKRKTNGSSAGFVDDDLEDTASSPVNSPKISSNMENHFDKNLKMKEAMEISEKNKASGSSGRIDERNEELCFINSSENDETQLKKMGLCLVPLSMVVQYIG